MGGLAPIERIGHRLVCEVPHFDACHSRTFYAFFGLLFGVTEIVCRICCSGRSWLWRKGDLKHGIVKLNCATLTDKYRAV